MDFSHSSKFKEFAGPQTLNNMFPLLLRGDLAFSKKRENLQVFTSHFQGHLDDSVVGNYAENLISRILPISSKAMFCEVKAVGEKNKTN